MKLEICYHKIEHIVIFLLKYKTKVVTIMIDLSKLFGNIKLTPVEENIITYLIENIDDCMNKGIRTIAKDTFTSPSTIIRLSKKLGYSGFVELTYSLKNKISSQGTANFADETRPNLFATNYEGAIEDFITYIEKGNILVSGEGFSEIVSKYMYMKLLVLGKKSFFSTFIDLDVLLDHHAEHIDTLILISKSGEGTHCVNSCLHAKERNLNIVSFTGNKESTLAKLSNITFIISDCEKLDNDNFYPNPFFAYCIEVFEQMLHRYFNTH